MLKAYPSYILALGFPKSILHYWEMRWGDVVEDVLRMLLKLLSLIDYHSTVDSNKDEKKRKKQNTA